MAPHKHPDTAHEEIVTNLEVKSAAHLKTNKQNFQFLFFTSYPMDKQQRAHLGLTSQRLIYKQTNKIFSFYFLFLTQWRNSS